MLLSLGGHSYVIVKTLLQHLGIAVAINLVRLVAWLDGDPLAPIRVCAYERLFNVA